LRAAFTVAALSFAVAVPSHAERLTDLYKEALGTDPRVAAARYDLEASGKGVDQARAALLPSINFEADTQRDRQRIKSSQNAIIAPGLSEFPVNAHTLTITQPIFRWAAYERLLQSRASVRQAAALQLAADQGLILRLAQAYLGVLAAKDNLDLAQAEKKSLAGQLELVEARLQRGLATLANAHEARARYAQTDAREVEARNLMQDAEQGVHEILARRLKRVFALVDDIPLTVPDPASVEAWVEAARAKNLAVQGRRAAVEVASQEVHRQRAGHYPTLDLIGQHVDRKQGGTLFGGGSHVETGSLILRLHVPIFDGFGTQAVTEEAVARHEKAKQELEQELRQVERQARASYNGVVGAVSQVNALRQAVLSQESAVAVKQESFRSGLLTVIAVVDAQRDLYFARRDYARARYDYLVNRLRLKQATGTLGEDDLALIDRLLR
jgi:outer membrane protein